MKKGIHVLIRHFAEMHKTAKTMLLLSVFLTEIALLAVLFHLGGTAELHFALPDILSNGGASLLVGFAFAFLIDLAYKESDKTDD